jgi:hypothetical protein
MNYYLMMLGEYVFKFVGNVCYFVLQIHIKYMENAAINLCMLRIYEQRGHGQELICFTYFVGFLL